MTAMNEDWPALRYEDWKDTYATLHMWSQVVGKIALTHGPVLNHSWGAALHLTSRGFETAVLTHGSRQFTIQFDFVEHRLVIAAADGETRVMPLVSRSVADFYRDVMTTLEQGLSEQCVGLQRVAPGCCHHCLSSRGTLILCTSTMADRNGLTYGGPVVPDEVLGRSSRDGAGAIDWLRQ